MAYVNSLEDIQSLIGDIETWPSEIINHILIGEYNRKNIFRVISFFYGNCVPVGLALSFYTKCNHHNKFLALCHFTLLYNLWDMGQNKNFTCNTCAYYVVLKKRMWINRSRRGGEEDPPIPLGIESTGNAVFIRSKLNEVFG